MDKFENLEIMQSFNEKNLPSLSTAVLGALELFMKNGIPQTKFPDLKKPIVVGSGNAIATARILFENTNAVFADENNYKEVLNITGIDGAVIFSASGEKHATIISKYYISKNIDTYLITCNKDSSAAKIVGIEKTIVTDKNPEPYTYNTSTYMGWMFAKSKEDPKKIYDYIKKINISQLGDLGKFNGYLLVTPNEFSGLNHLFDVKFKELFGRRVARDVETYENLKHAVTVVPYENELCIKFGVGNVNFDESRTLEIKLPKDISYAGLMAIGYYVIGKIQENKPQYFKKNIGNFICDMNKTSFGKNLSVIVK